MLWPVSNSQYMKNATVAVGWFPSMSPLLDRATEETTKQ
jgi:hypothetical protein